MDYLQEIFQQAANQEVNWANASVRLVLSMLLGAIIGIERMKKGQMAGMRTFSLICTGATLAMLVSIYIPQEYMGLKNGDPGRIAAQVVSGIGFLGAGAIIQMKGSVRGLTTAAGIWITAMIGLAVGSGMYLIAIITTALIIFILVMMNRCEHITNMGGESKIIRIKEHGIVYDVTPIRSLFKQYKVHISEMYLKYDYDSNVTVVNLLVRCKATTDFISIFAELHKSSDIGSITLSNEVNL